MQKKNKQKDDSKIEKFLASLDNLWSRLLVIGLIAIAGFKFGCYYKETQMNRSQQLLDKEMWERWVEKEEMLKKQIDELKQERIELKANIQDLKLQNKYGYDKEE